MKYFLFFILVITTRFYNLSFLRESPMIDFLNLGFSLFFIGALFFKRQINYKLFKSLKNFLRLAVVAVLLSFFVSYIDWNQPFLISIVASRAILWISFGFFLIRYQVRKEDIINALKYFSIIYLLLVYSAKLSPQLNFLYLGIDRAGYRIEDPLFFAIEYVVLYFYFVVDKALNQKYDFKNYLWFLTLLLLIVFTKNRTTLFTSLLIIGGYILFSKKLNILYKIAIILMISAPGYLLFADTFFALWDETLLQSNDDEYARIKAFKYFTNDFNESWYSKVFGNGFASSYTPFGQMIDRLKLEDTTQSDLGMIGLWSIYGSLLIFIIYRYVFRILTNKKASVYLRLQSAHFLIAFLMYSFVLPQQIVFFILWFYIYELEINTLLIRKKRGMNFEVSPPDAKQYSHNVKY